MTLPTTLPAALDEIARLVATEGGNLRLGLMAVLVPLAIVCIAVAVWRERQG